LEQNLCQYESSRIGEAERAQDTGEEDGLHCIACVRHASAVMAILLESLHKSIVRALLNDRIECNTESFFLRQPQAAASGSSVCTQHLAHSVRAYTARLQHETGTVMPLAIRRVAGLDFLAQIAKCDTAGARTTQGKQVGLGCARRIMCPLHSADLT
jgi:hypothetical protein